VQHPSTDTADSATSPSDKAIVDCRLTFFRSGEVLCSPTSGLISDLGVVNLLWVVDSFCVASGTAAPSAVTLML
jgi:hypothetical protein